MRFFHTVANQKIGLLQRCLLISIFTLVLIVSTSLAQDSNTTVSAGTSSNGMPVLVGPNGLTLYTFSLDDDGESVCYDQCAANWPPLTVDTGTVPVIGTGVMGSLGTVERDDGTTQVTYDGWPLYYYAQDAAAGDAFGQGIRDIWFVASPATIMLRNQAGVGDILVGAGGLSLYVFMEDELEEDESESYCFEECEVAWPPVIVPEGMEPTAGEGVTGELGTVEREDGSRHVTYNGWPLYYFKMDRDPGDITGNGMKSVWYLAMVESAAYADSEEESLSVGVELVAEGFSSPVSLASNNGRLFIADQAGTIHIVDENGSLLETPFLDLTDRIVELMPGYDERGVLGMAFHPDYANNGRFFVYYTAPLRAEAPADWDHTNVVAEFRVSDDPHVADPNSEQIIWMLDQPQFNHDAGHIAFGPDGYLYIPIGDGGGANDTGLGHTEGIGNAQDLTNQHGSILRIDVNNGAPYTIPADNPFGDEIYAYGLRNPYHISFDSGGRLFVADAGQDLYEEVSIVTLGGNYGWNIMEGSHCFDPNNPTVPPAECGNTDPAGTSEALIDPVIEYDHTLGIVVVGGYVVEGGSLSSLNGYYLFGSYSRTFMPPNGLLFAAQVGDVNSLWDFSELEVSNGEEGKLGAYLLAFGMDEAGEIYVMTTENSAPEGDTGKVWRLVNADEAQDMNQEDVDSEDAQEEEATPADDSESDTDTEQEAAPTSEPATAPTSEPATAPPPDATEDPKRPDIGDYAQDGSGDPAMGDSSTIAVAYTNDGIPTLVDGAGLTLYTFAFDHDGESTCYDACAEEWPPLIVEESQTINVEGIPGEFSTVEREDGSFQLAYRGWPLYYYHEDAAAGDANGQGLQDVWFAANPADVMLSANGRYLVGAGGMTLYIFTMDEANESYCRDVCAIAWPALTLAEGSEFLVMEGVTGAVEVFQRDDGEMQLSYEGRPLYFFRGDMAPGEANGDGIKDVWYVASLNRDALEPGAPTPEGTDSPEATSPAPEATVETTAEVTDAPETTPEVTPPPAEETPEATTSP